jgi:hypothetical protein
MALAGARSMELEKCMICRERKERRREDGDERKKDEQRKGENDFPQ